MTVRYTGQNGSSRMGINQPRAAQAADTGQMTADAGQTGRSVGMAYIPEQKFDNLYDAKCGLTEGTMFKELNLIFCGVRGKA